jgi:spore maturation protein CgeB
MNIAFFYHSLLSDWNHGNAHFLRGIAWELKRRGHFVRVFEPALGWSLSNLLRERGSAPLEQFARLYPGLKSSFYDLATLDLDRALASMDLVIVHEWNEPELIARIGAHRQRGGYQLFFHDTHHKSATEPAAVAGYDLSGYDGVLAYGATIRQRYLSQGWSNRVWVWHEAADPRIFRPFMGAQSDGDLVWIGNWGDDERSAELGEFLIEPVRALKLKAAVYGVRYPKHALDALARAGIAYRGWLPNYEVPRAFARYQVTLHIPRRIYAGELAGIPTIRPFEALASGIPLICSPWADVEGLFTAGRDYLVARDGDEMIRMLRLVLGDSTLARALSAHGLKTILARHTCAHRVDQLFSIVSESEGLRAGSNPAQAVGA